MKGLNDSNRGFGERYGRSPVQLGGLDSGIYTPYWGLKQSMNLALTMKPHKTKSQMIWDDGSGLGARVAGFGGFGV